MVWLIEIKPIVPLQQGFVFVAVITGVFARCIECVANYREAPLLYPAAL